MNKIYFIFLFFIKTELVNFDELSDIKSNIKIETINDDFKKCSDLYYKIFNKKLLFQDYKECLLSNLDDLENVHKYLIFNQLFFQKFNTKLSKEDLKKYLLFVYDKNNFDNELKNFQILLEVLFTYKKEKKDLVKNDFSILLYLINSLKDERDSIINCYTRLNNKKILKIKEILNNDQNFLSIFQILMRWKCDLNSSCINKVFLEDLLITEDYFKKHNKILSYLEFETLQNKKNTLNLSISQLLLSESDYINKDKYNGKNIENNKIKGEKQKTDSTKINMSRDENKNEKKISVINVETGGDNMQYIIESSKNDKLIIKIKNNSCEEKINEEILKKNPNENKMENNESESKNCAEKNKQNVLKGSFVLVVLLILFI